MIPNFPNDATITSIHLACIYSLKSKDFKLSCKEIYGKEFDFQENIYGYHASNFSSILLKDENYALTLMKNHSLLPIFINQNKGSDFDIIDYNRVTTGQAFWLKNFKTIYYGIGMSQNSRVCPSCKIEDLSKYGFCHLHLLHQIPAIHYCPHHGDTLHDQCAACLSPIKIEGKWRIYGNGCENCKSTTTSSSFKINRSKGSHLFLDLLKDNLREKGSRISKKEIIHSINNKTNNHPNFNKIENYLLNLWEIDSIRELFYILDTNSIHEQRLATYENIYAGKSCFTTSFPILGALYCCLEHMSHDYN